MKIVRRMSYKIIYIGAFCYECDTYSISIILTNDQLDGLIQFGLGFITQLSKH